MIYYLHPYVDKNTPTGGVLKIFEHIKILNNNGIKAKAVYYTDSFISDATIEMQDEIIIRLNWANIKMNSISIKKLISIVEKNDTIVIPEIRPRLINFFPAAKNKIIFVQNWHKIIPKKFGLKKNQTYMDLGYNYVITCSDFLTKYVKQKIQKKNGGNHTAGEIPVFTVNNSVNNKIFYKIERQRISNRIIMISRKGKQFIKTILKKSKKLNYTFTIIDKHISQEELADKFRQSDIYIHTGFPEGFGLPVLEAQLCGVLAIGFSGGGADELMLHNKSSLVAEDGNTKKIIQYLNFLQYNSKVKEQLRKEGYNIALKHTLTNEKNLLLKAFNTILKN